MKSDEERFSAKDLNNAYSRGITEGRRTRWNPYPDREPERMAGYLVIVRLAEKDDSVSVGWIESVINECQDKETFLQKLNDKIVTYSDVVTVAYWNCYGEWEVYPPGYDGDQVIAWAELPEPPEE